MEIKKIPISEVEVWKKNLEVRATRTEDYNHTKSQIQRLGIYKPVTAFPENGRYYILGGRLRYFVIRDLKHDHIDVSIVHPKTEAEKWEYVLSDNDQPSTWLEDKLAENLYQHLEAIRMEDYKITLAAGVPLGDLIDEFGPTSYGQEDEDDAPLVESLPQKTKRGDLFVLGKHLLMCGDATKEKDLVSLLGGDKVDMVFTDPPYNVNYEGMKFEGILGDNQTEAEFIKFSLDFMKRIKESLRWGGSFYICSGYSSYPIFLYAAKRTGLEFSTPIVWVKNASALGWSDYRHKHEMVLRGRNKRQKKAQPILYGWNGGKHYFLDTRFEADVWEVKKRTSNTMMHPTQKPVALIRRALKNSSKQGDTIIDMFAGSGSTIIAADQMQRRCLAMELDPRYCDVIIKRFSTFTDIPEEKIRGTRKNG